MTELDECSRLGNGWSEIQEKHGHTLISPRNSRYETYHAKAGLCLARCPEQP